MNRACLVALGITLTIGCGNGDDGAAEQQSIDPTDFIPTKGRVPPRFLFAKAVQCDRPEVNEFITRFSKVCLRGEYLNYRLLVSRQVEPFSRDSFQRAWEAVERVRINRIVQAHDLTSYPPPVYLVAATIAMREPADPPSREATILVFKEGQQWVMAPAPRSTREAETASQPTNASGR